MSAILFGKSCNFARSVHLHIRLFLFARGQLYCWHDFTNLTVRRAKRGFQPFSCLLLQTCIAKTCQVRGKDGLYMYATRAVQAQIGNLVKFASRDSAVTHINSTTGNMAFYWNICTCSGDKYGKDKFETGGSRVWCNKSKTWQICLTYHNRCITMYRPDCNHQGMLVKCS